MVQRAEIGHLQIQVMLAKPVRITEGGKLVIPASFRRALGIAIGDTVILEATDGILRVRSRDSAIAEAQAMMRELVPDGESISDELIADRRAEAARE